MQEQDRPADAGELQEQTETAIPNAGTGEQEHAGGGNPASEVMPSVEELLRQAELAAQEHHDAWLRAKADTENMRKRAQIDVANAHKYALENFALQLLPVRDSLEAALASPNLTLESLNSGVELTLKQLNGAFDKVNIKQINPLGEKLDPHKHEAMSAVESDAAPNSIVSVFQKGYELNDRLVRPALVSVAKPKGS
jgi:molecular chaperone GrpE